MFTGIIESLGRVESISGQGTGKIFWISSPLTPELKVDQSLAHNGACLTVEQLAGDQYMVTAIHETLLKTNLGNWRVGETVNLERSMQVNGRLDGHLVQGHIDTTGTCINIKQTDGSWEFQFRFPAEFSSLIIEKGSICVNGISLTAFDVTHSEFTVAIIPYTYEHTNIRGIAENDTVNLEFDVIGKYIQKHLADRIFN